MPRVTVTNNTKVPDSSLPNGVALDIKAGGAAPVRLEVGQTQTFTIARNGVIEIKPTNAMMQRANYLQRDDLDKAISVIPADRDNAFGVTFDFVQG